MIVTPGGVTTISPSAYVNVAIDGPAGSGKSTIAKELAKHFDILYPWLNCYILWAKSTAKQLPNLMITFIKTLYKCKMAQLFNKFFKKFLILP